MKHGNSIGVFSGIAKTLVVVLVFMVSLFAQQSANAFTVTVVDDNSPANQVTGFKWLLEEDTTNQPRRLANGQFELQSDSLAVSVHSSHAPVVSSGESATSMATIPVPDPTKRYLLTVRPNSGYTVGGGTVVNDQDIQVIVNQHNIPTAQISILAFLDHDPIDNFPQVVGFRGQPIGNEIGLEGFSIELSDGAGKVTQDAFGNPLGTTYVFNDTNGNTVHDPGETYSLIGGEPVVLELGSGVVVTGPDGRVVLRNLVPNKYGVVLVPPQDGREYIQTTTIEGTPTVDAWVGANNPQQLIEFGPAFNHIFIGFVIPEELPWALVPPQQGDLGPDQFLGSINGRILNNHLTRPPLLQFFPGHPIPDCMVALNDIGGTGEGVVTTVCNEDGTFTLDGVPPGLYQMAIWDKPLDYIFFFATVSVPDNNGAGGGADVVVGDILVNAWFNSLEGNIFYDANENGFRDDPIAEPGLVDQGVVFRFRDGTIYQATVSDPAGDYAMNEVFPFFHWLVVEVDFAKFKATGATFAIDAGGEITSVEGEFPGDGKMNPQVQDPLDPANENADMFWRTETGPVLTSAYFGFAGQTNRIDWGKRDYLPGEHGGISGIVFYAVTVAEDDVAYAAAEEWEPGIPRVQVNLYEDLNMDEVIDDQDGGGVMLADVDNHPLGWAEGGAMSAGDIDRDGNGTFDMHDAVDVTWTDSWDDSGPTGCIQPETIVNGEVVDPCFDNLGTWNQIRPQVFDGGYAFDGMAPGQYIVEAATPPGYSPLLPEHKNVDFGDVWTPSAQVLPPVCVGDGRVVPQYLAFQTDAAGTPLLGIDPADLIEAPFAGTTRATCDRKVITATAGKNAAVDFFAFPPVPKGARGVGFINNDFGAERNPFSPNVGEKASPSWLPISFKNYKGQEVTRVYSDEFGAYNVLVPSTYTVNVASPSGVNANMYTICLNDPGPIPDPDNPGQMIIDPFFDTNYSNTCYTFNFEPGRTIYLDTPVIQIAAFVNSQNRILDVLPADGVPTIASVTGPGGATLDCLIEGNTVVINSLGLTEVPNPDFDPDVPGSTTLITRDYGFGGTEGTVTLGGLALNVISWNTDAITATIPAGAATGQLQVTKSDGAVAESGVTLHAGACGNVVQVSAGESIQDAIDGAPAGSLILVGPGSYFENVVLYKDVRLQGSGAGSTIIEALPIPAERVQQWQDYVTGLVAGVDYDLLPGQDLNALVTVNAAPGVLVLADDTTPATPWRIDGFTIRSANAGGGVYVNAYADNGMISNNRITNNLGNEGGGIHIGNPAFNSINDNISIMYNQVLQNGGINGGSGISYYAGTDNLVISHNRISGNFTRADGGGIYHGGPSDNVYIGQNIITFNEVFYGENVGGNGGGIAISGLPAVSPDPTPGAGNVTIEGNLLQGNLAGSASGGGLFVGDFNGTDATYQLKVFDNIIVNNIAATAGGGIFVSDVAADNAKIINNTVANNDSTATSALANVASPQSTPQIAGIAVANAAPVLQNNILYNNRSFYRDGTEETVPGEPQFGLGLLHPASDHPSGLYTLDTWDVGVFGTVGVANPDYSLLTTFTGTMGGIVFDHNDGTNVVGDPAFVSPYFTNLTTAQAGDEGGNFVNVFPDPLTTEGSDYHIGVVSAAFGNGTAVDTGTYPELGTDFDGETRPQDSGVEIGADEFPIPPSTLLAPNGGEMLTGGQIFNVQWGAFPGAAFYRLRYSVDGGTNWLFIDRVDGATSYNWTVPNADSANVLFRVTAHAAGGGFLDRDESDAPFTIIPGSTVLQPNGGEVLTVGQNFNVQWTAFPDAAFYRLRYSVDGGTTWLFIDRVDGATSYNWTVPVENSANVLFRVTAHGAGGGFLGRDESDAPFTIGPVLLQPNGGEVLTVGQVFNVQWTAFPDAAFYRLRYSVDGGTNWLFIDRVDGATSYNWTVPVENSANVLFRVTAHGAGGGFLDRDESDAPFTIAP